MADPPMPQDVQSPRGGPWSAMLAWTLGLLVIAPGSGLAQSSGADAGPNPSPDAGAAPPDVSPSPPDETTSEIAEVELQCDLELCDDPVRTETFLSLAALYPGRRLDDRTLEIARTRLVKTGVFKQIAFDREPTVGGGVRLTVIAKGSTRIRSVTFRGVSPPPFRSELRRLLIYHPGEVYENDISKRSAQLSSLEAEFRKEGYFGSDVELLVEEAPDRPKLVDLTFKIEKGDELNICDIGLRGVKAMTYAEARSYLLKGVPFYSRRLGLKAPRYTSENVAAGEEALIEQYRKRGYFRARVVDKAVQRDRSEGCVTILLDIDEGPQWELEFRGNQELRDGLLEQHLPFYETGYVDDAEIRRAERELESLYETRGHPFAEVTGREERIDRLNRRIVFEVRERRKFQISEIVVHGNDVLSTRELTRKLGTRSFQLFGTGGLLQTSQLLSDIRRIEKRYHARGYLQARVRRYELELDRNKQSMRVHVHIREGERVSTPSVRYDGMRNLTRERLREKVDVHQGEPFVPVQVRADRSRIKQLYSSAGYPLAEVETTCRLLDGREVPCRRPELPERCTARTPEAIEARCRWKGEERKWLTCQRILDDPSCKWRGETTSDSDGTSDSPASDATESGDDAEEGSNAKPTSQGAGAGASPTIGDHTAIRVTHRVEEGPLVTIGEFLVQGNFETKDRVILQEIPLRRGDLFDVQKVLKGQSNLRSLGIFDSVSIEAIGLDDAAARTRQHEVALLVSVQESRNRFVDVEMGLEGRDIFGQEQKLLTTTQLQYNNRNLFGIGDRLKPRVFGALDFLQLIGWSRSLLEGSGVDLGRFDYLVGAELVYHDPRFLKRATGVDKLSLTLTPFYLRDLLGLVDEEFLREEWGIRLEFRKELTELLERFFINFGLEGKQAATVPNDKQTGVPNFTPRRIVGKLIPELTLDRRDNPLLPRKGYRLKFTPEYVTGDALSRQRDTFKDSYFRMSWTSNAFVPLWSDLVVAQGFRFGQVVPASGRDVPVPPDERYHLGGAGSLRGFPNNSVGPRWIDQPNGGEFLMNYTLELRFPLLKNLNFRGAVFFDTGFLVDCFPESGEQRDCYEDAFASREEFEENLRSSAGLGLRYVISGQIPVLFDYGVVLDRQKGEGYGSLHFHLGYTF